MANPEHLAILNQGVSAWNEWRKERDTVLPDLSHCDLQRAHLQGASLMYASLVGANLTEAKLGRANLMGADLASANLIGANLLRAVLADSTLTDANFTGANLIAADLSNAMLNGATLDGAKLSFADLTDANLIDATLIGAEISNAKLHGVHLGGADVSEAIFFWNGIGNCDLRGVNGLEAVTHGGPSYISIDTIYKSEGQIPEPFLLGCGVPDSFIAQIPALVGALQPIQFYSCFISYSTKDEEFARRLHERMRAEKLRVWFAPEDIQGGKKLHEHIERAIQVHDRLLLVLSDNSTHSEWVMTEIRNASKVEIKDNRRKLFPIRLCGYEALRAWKCFDGDTGKDLATEVREYFIPDFSNWKNHDNFEAAFARLLRDLRASEC